MDKMIDLRDLEKFFGSQRVLNGVSLELFSGQIIGLIGPSGAGKSTLIKTLLGMEKADGGQALVIDTRMPNRHILGDIGYMAQSDALYEALSGRENLEFFGQMNGLSKINLKEQFCLSDLSVPLLQPHEKSVLSSLSLAIALLGNPKLLILDEPTVGIDPALRRKIWQELDVLRQQNCAILVTTHVMDEAELTDKVALLLHGNIIAFDTPQGLKEQFAVDSIEEVFLKAEGVI